MTERTNAPEILDDAEMDRAQGGLVTSLPNDIRIEHDNIAVVAKRRRKGIITSMEEGETCTI